MSWATQHVAALQRGDTVQFRPVGGSMKGRIESGALVTVEPLRHRDPEVGEAVLCTVKGRHFLHLVKEIRGGHVLPKQFQIGNNRGGVNGWVTLGSIYGRVTEVRS